MFLVGFQISSQKIPTQNPVQNLNITATRLSEMNPKASGGNNTESRTEQSSREKQRAEQRTSLREEESCSNEMVGGGGMGCLCRQAPNGETRLSAPSRCNRPAPSCACRRYPGRQQAQRWSRQTLRPSDSHQTKLSLSLPLECYIASQVFLK